MHGLIFETSVCYWQNQPGCYLSLLNQVSTDQGRKSPQGQYRIVFSCVIDKTIPRFCFRPVPIVWVNRSILPWHIQPGGWIEWSKFLEMNSPEYKQHLKTSSRHDHLCVFHQRCAVRSPPSCGHAFPTRLSWSVLWILFWDVGDRWPDELLLKFLVFGLLKKIVVHSWRIFPLSERLRNLEHSHSRHKLMHCISLWHESQQHRPSTVQYRPDTFCFR